MIRVGLIGCGSIMGAHLPGWKAVEGRAQVVAACDVQEANARKRAEELGGTARVFTDWKALLSEGNVDAVDVALPHHLHRDAIVDAAEAGKHILTEKPLCTTLEEARDIEAAVKANGVTLVCAHCQMFEPAPRTARQWIKEGKIGRVFSLRTVDCFYFPVEDKAKWGWRGSAAEAGGGCALDTGYHPTYLLISIANSEPKEVVSFSANYNQPTLDAEDTAQTMVRFANGAVGTLETSWGHPVPNGHWQFHAIGEKGQIFGRGNNLYFQPLQGEIEKHILEPENGFVGEIKHFVECIETGKTPEQGLHEGITVLKVILGGYQSEHEKRVIPL
ncbi:MAG TPA: Gfo/Idh/MocA family oxidoreductase [Chthonomonadaceae bacterium]|nr:Gfo/Idh/MocA family oxidoreductase [Chthonomonadaceae bacterium]